MQQRPSAEDYDEFKDEDRNPVKAASRHRVEEANRKRNQEREEAALSVDITKFERAAWLLTAGCLVIVAVSVHVLTRFHYGFKWVATSLLAVAPLYLWLSSNIRESFLAEVRERKADAAKDVSIVSPSPQDIADASLSWKIAKGPKVWRSHYPRQRKRGMDECCYSKALAYHQHRPCAADARYRGRRPQG